MTMCLFQQLLGRKKFRGGSLFGPWLLCLMFYLTISVKCAVSKCSEMSDVTVWTYPSGDINLLYPGTPLEIFCTAERNYTSRDLEFRIGTNQIPSTIINETTIRLYVEQPEIQRKTYYCTNKAANRHCLNKVLVETPPKDVTDFSCFSNDLEYLNCSWSTPKTLSDIKYNLSFYRINALVTPCKAERDINTMYYSCMWNLTTEPRYRQQNSEYVFYLRSCNHFGCNSQNITIDHYAVVKPKKPSDLTVIKVHAHKVLLKWGISSNIYDFLSCGIDHRIEYQIAKIDKPSVFRQVNVTSLPSNNKTYRYELGPLPYAHMQYEVRVYIKSKLAKDDLWSEFSYVVFTTDSEIPARPPGMPAGAFTSSPYVATRKIYIYWNQLEAFEENGANFTYRALVTQDGVTRPHWPEKNKSLSFVYLENASMNPLQISVKSENRLGLSDESSYLYIPSDKQMLKGPTSFTKLAYENGTYELSWNDIDSNYIDNYTLFWCQYNWTQVCVGRMNYTSLDPRKNNHVIDLPRDTKYQFAISVNSGIRTSGMVWAMCDISKDGEAMYDFPVHLSHLTPNKTFVELVWTMDCKLRDGIITGYNITYCPIVDIRSNLCDDTVGYHSVYVSNPRSKNVNVTELLPWRTYIFQLTLNTKYGPKLIKNATTEVTTMEDTPSNPVNITVSNIKNDSMMISWDPPIKKNGNIKKYVIFNHGKEYASDVLSSPNLTDISKRNFTLTGLQGFTNYSWKIQACNTWCSVIKDSETINVRTRFGPPSTVEAPTVKRKPDVLVWSEPLIPSGFVDLYQVKIVKDNKRIEYYNTTETQMPFDFCDGVHEMETYQVRAINFDEHPNYGAYSSQMNVYLTVRDKDDIHTEYAGEWSLPSTVACGSTNTLTMTFVAMVLLCVGLVAIYGAIKVYKGYGKMKDVFPVLPNGLDIPAREPNTKYTFGWHPQGKEAKPASSDELLLLPDTKTPVPPAEIKQNDDNCGASDHTDSTALSDSSRGGPAERESTSSDVGSESSLHLDMEIIKDKDDKSESAGPEDESTCSDSDSSRGDSPCLNEICYQTNPKSGYVQHTTKLSPGYVQNTVMEAKKPIVNALMQPTTSSYVRAGLTPPIFAMRSKPAAPSRPEPSSGYIRPEDVQAKSFMNFPQLGSSPTKQFGPESLPTMPTLPSSNNSGCDSSYIQLQSLEGISSKPVMATMSMKPPPADCIRAGDALIHKHLGMLSGGQLADEPAILDPAMSPDAYCRFSWSIDPANDNLNTLLRNPATDSNKN